MSEPFRPPRGITGFNIDDTPAQRLERTSTFERWAHAVAQSSGQRATTVASTGNYDVMQFDGADLWLLHNHHLPLVAALGSAPVAGFAFAVQCEFIDIDVPAHLATWGPTVIPANHLNRELEHEDWANFSPPAQAHADKFKPTHVGHIVFTHWD